MDLRMRVVESLERSRVTRFENYYAYCPGCNHRFGHGKGIFGLARHPCPGLLHAVLAQVRDEISSQIVDCYFYLRREYGA